MADKSHTYYHSPLGLIRIVGTDDYISTVSFYDASEKHESRKKPMPPLLINCIEQLIQYFNGERRIFDLPIHQEGTPFQQSVWSELVQIPYARTISYLDLARRTGDTKATRAVANANGKNDIAIIVPCHRVIGSKGDLVGYAGGMHRKKWLLDHEKKVCYGVQTLF